MQLTTAMGRAGDEEDLLLEPYQVLDVIPRLARLKERAEAARMRLSPATTSGTSDRTRPSCARPCPTSTEARAAPGGSRWGSRPTATIKGCPSLPTADYVGGNVRDHSLAGDMGADGAAALHARSQGRRPPGLLPDLLLRRRCLAGCNWTTHVLLGKTGNNPYCHHRALELLRDGKRERLVKTRPAEGMPFDYGRFEIVVETWPAEEAGANREGVDA